MALDACGVYRFADGEYEAPDQEEEGRVTKYIQEILDHDLGCWEGYCKAWIPEIVSRRIEEHRQYNKDKS
jgi:hypothetical protein